jgi:hypothetical protein
LVCAFEPPEPAALPVEVVVLACAFDPPDDVVGADTVPAGLDVAVDGEDVVEELLVCNVEVPPEDFVSGESVRSGWDDQLIAYALVVLPFV